MKKDKVCIKNRKASFDYFFVRNLIAGIMLRGSEIKQIRNGRVSLVDSFCYFEKDEIFVKGINITSVENFSHDPHREKKLLLKKQEIKKLKRDLEDGMTIVVKSLFENERGLLKMEIALAKGKKNFDKRNSIKEREAKKAIRSLNENTVR